MDAWWAPSLVQLELHRCVHPVRPAMLWLMDICTVYNACWDVVSYWSYRFSFLLSKVAKSMSIIRSIISKATELFQSYCNCQGYPWLRLHIELINYAVNNLSIEVPIGGTGRDGLIPVVPVPSRPTLPVPLSISCLDTQESGTHARKMGPQTTSFVNESPS